MSINLKIMLLYWIYIFVSYNKFKISSSSISIFQSNNIPLKKYWTTCKPYHVIKISLWQKYS